MRDFDTDRTPDDLMEQADELRAARKDTPDVVPPTMEEAIVESHVPLRAVKRETPEHVKWSQIHAAKGLPKEWKAISHPYPIPGGALFLIQAYTPRMRRDLYIIFSWDMDSEEVNRVDIGKAPAIFGNNAIARERIATIARSLCAA